MARRPTPFAVCIVLAACGGPDRNSFDTAPADSGAMETTVPQDTAPADAAQCASNADCDDHLACTTDLCLIGGVCQHTSQCTNGLHCTTNGCSATVPCTSNADCDDHIDCTQDICAAGGVCQNLRDDSRCDVTMMQTCSVVLGCVAMGRCAVDADCSDGRYCNGMETCTNGACVAGTPVSCDDMDSCTADACVESTMSCTHTPISPCGGTVTSGTYALSPVPQFTCADGSIGPVSTIMLTVTATSVTVTGFSGSTLTGGAPSMGMFSVMGPWAGSPCGGTITLSGSFTMSGYFMGTWSLSAGTCDPSCNYHFDTTNGTLQH